MLPSTNRWSVDGRNPDCKVCCFSLGPHGRLSVVYIGWFGLCALAIYCAHRRPWLSETGSTLASAFRWSMAALL